MSKTIEQLEQEIKTVTDRMTLVDQILKAQGRGVKMIPAFRCGESGLWYPGDYIKLWGKKYGIGLGYHPCSESLQSMYEVQPPTIDGQIKKITQVMHPLRVSGCQMDFDLVDEETFKEKSAVLVVDDLDMEKRGPILRKKQLANSAGQLKIMQAAWERMGR
jgi:hypothetical protein